MIYKTVRGTGMRRIIEINEGDLLPSLDDIRSELGGWIISRCMSIHRPVAHITGSLSVKEVWAIYPYPMATKRYRVYVVSGRKCLNCSKPVKQYGNKYCSRSCWSLYLRRAAEKRYCLTCGKQLTPRPRYISVTPGRNYCGQTCAGVSRRVLPRIYRCWYCEILFESPYARTGDDHSCPQCFGLYTKVATRVKVSRERVRQLVNAIRRKRATRHLSRRAALAHLMTKRLGEWSWEDVV